VTVPGLSLLASGLFVWVAIVHLLMAAGVRRGELVWSGRYPRRLVPELRWRSLVYGLLLILSAWVVAAFGGAFDFAPVPERWFRSAGWSVTAFLSVVVIHAALKGSRWERMFFLPIALFGALLAGWLTFG
jgi:hypothetical protein